MEKIKKAFMSARVKNGTFYIDGKHTKIDITINGVKCEFHVDEKTGRFYCLSSRLCELFGVSYSEKKEDYLYFLLSLDLYIELLYKNLRSVK